MVGGTFGSYVQITPGKRAREIFVLRTDLIREIGGSQMVHIFNVVLPTIANVMALAERDGVKVRKLVSVIS